MRRRVRSSPRRRPRCRSGSAAGAIWVTPTACRATPPFTPRGFSTSAFIASALYDCGFHVEGDAFVTWLIYSTRLTQPNLQMLYDVAGESKIPEAELEHLDGYAHSRPVHIGNAAHDQFQL